MDSGEVTVTADATLFRRHRSYFSHSNELHTNSTIDPAERRIRQWFAKSARSLGLRQMRWLKAVILGEMDQLPRDLHRAVKATGLHHLLVISGIHLTVVTQLTFLALGFIPTTLYALRLISATRWLDVQAIMRLINTSISVMYFILVGCPPNAERALIATVTYNIFRVFVGSPPAVTHLQVMLLLQSLIFPIGFIGEANLLGWGAYLILAHTRIRLGFRNKHGLHALMQSQISLCLLGTAVFGELNFLPILFMPALMPVFTCLLTMTGMAFLLPETLQPEIALSQLHRALQWLLLTLETAVTRWPWLSIGHDVLPPWFRYSALILSAVILLNAIRALSTCQSTTDF